VWVATGTKQCLVASYGIHRDLCWKVDSHKTWTSLYLIQTLHELDCYLWLSLRGSSKQYTNLVIWYRPRVNTFYCLCLSFHFLLLLPLVPSSLQHLPTSLANMLSWKYLSESSKCRFRLQFYFRLHRLYLSSANFMFNFQLYFRTSQATIVFYQFFKFNC
jgi:hypothetical protein